MPKVELLETLNMFYRVMPKDSQRKFKNFDGYKKTSIKRINNDLCKITKVEGPNKKFIYAVLYKNTGTEYEPMLKPAILSVSSEGEELQVHYRKWGETDKGLRICHYKGLNLLTALWDKYYKNFEELRKDPYLIKLFEKITGKKIS